MKGKTLERANAAGRRSVLANFFFFFFCLKPQKKITKIQFLTLLKVAYSRETAQYLTQNQKTEI